MTLKRLQWIGCKIAFHIYLWLPHSRTHESRYGRFCLWLLGYGGAYAYNDTFADFCANTDFKRGRAA